MKNSKPIMIIVSLLAAICLWIYVVTVVNPDGETMITNIPVTFSGAEVLKEDHGLVISDGYQEFVSVRFSGKNSDLKKLEKEKDQISAVVDVSKVRSTKEYSLGYEIELPDNVQVTAITNMEKNPSAILISIERWISKPIEIRGDFSRVEIAEGYMLDSTGFDYETVTVEGPESAVSKVSYALVTMQRTNVDKSISEDVVFQLMDADDAPITDASITTDVDTIGVSVNVVMYKEVPLELSVLSGGGATASDCTISFEPKTVTLSGDATILDGLNSIVLDPLDLSLLDSNSTTITRQIMIPNEAKNVSGEEEAVINIEIRNKDITTVKTTNILFINEQDGLEATSISQQLTVTIRADAMDVSKISENNIRVVADMEEYTQVGTYQVPVTVYIDGYPNAGVIGTYSIAATLAKLEQSES